MEIERQFSADNQLECLSCGIFDEIDSFSSIIGYERFLKYIESNELTEMKGNNKSLFYDERFFECKGCAQRWILAVPDPPFKGFWRKCRNSEC
ncbi:hypothetical protein P4631_00405 [Halalkalibacterium halodurans]|uniref:hypothetical protein n=1 Tax=Halalkalibacterium halodurans TaxID=86665 RepID=UPI002E1D6C16|nr:hypothetical protein [Halalkalibacterium halodurans]MED4170910.1 hypothetical protein [Halalkalibacterium halodurans]